MKHCFLKFLLLLFLLSKILLPDKIFASVVINEISWMGNHDSHTNEWIELYNNSPGLLDLQEWNLVSEDSAINIRLKGTIPAKGFYLLERTDDKSVIGINADQIYKGALKNNGQNLK